MVPVKKVAFWSRDCYKRAHHERTKVIEKSRAAIARGDMSASVARSSVRYVKDTPGAKAQHNWILDEEKIKANAAIDGYYCIITSEQEWSEHNIIDIYRGLVRIEESSA